MNKGIVFNRDDKIIMTGKGKIRITKKPGKFIRYAQGGDCFGSVCSGGPECGAMCMVLLDGNKNLTRCDVSRIELADKK